MIKKIALFLGLIFCVGSSLAKADVDLPALPKDFDDLSFGQLMEIIKNPSKNEQLLVQVLFSIPPEQHQYFMPAVANLFGISEKTRMMPGIVEWRRKLPTRIAPQLQDFAKEHLRYLNPVFYPYLMPEMWPDPVAQENNHRKDAIPRVYQTGSADEMEYLFPSSIHQGSLAKQVLSDTMPKPDKKSSVPALSAGDVDAVVHVMDKLKMLEYGEQGRNRRNTLIVDYIDTPKLIEAHVNPCQSLISRLDKIEADEWFKMQVEAENMTVEEFTQKCDATLKAYRMRLAAPGVARAVYMQAEDMRQLPKDSYPYMLKSAIVRMFDTTKENVQAVKGKEDELRKTFQEKKLFLGTPVLLDF